MAATEVSSAALSGKIYSVCGLTASGSLSPLFIYDSKYDAWRPLAPMPLPRHGFYGATSEGRIFAPSGGPQAGAHFSTANDAFCLPPAMLALSAVRNAASLAPAISLGSIATIFGSNLSFGEQIATTLPLPLRLNDVSVQVNGESAPLFYVSPGQINFYLPGIPAGETVAITVNNASAGSAPLVIGVSATAPALFSLAGSGSGPGAVLIAGTGTIAGVEHPARKGEIVEIHGTGLSTDALEIRIGGVPAVVLYAGPRPVTWGSLRWRRAFPPAHKRIPQSR